MSMKIAVYLATFLFGVAMSICPPGGFIACSGEGGYCDIHESISKGYISYGNNGRFNLIPFTNAPGQANGAHIQCDNDHGDIIPGTYKYCCYKAENHGFPDDRWQGYKAEGTGGWYFNPGGDGLNVMRYGASGNYIYRVLGGQAVGWCNNNYFNDPIYGVKKHCNWHWIQPASVGNSWRLCANEGGVCSGLNRNYKYWIRYGDHNKYYYRLVMADAVPCNNGFFEDPVPGVGKHCWVSNPFTQISGPDPDAFNNNDIDNYPGSPPKDVDEPYSYYINIDINSRWFILLCGIIIFVLFANIVYSLYINCCKKPRRYHTVKMVDTETDSESNPINI